MCFRPAAQQGGNFLCRIGIMKFHRCHAAKPFLESTIVVEIDIVLYCPDQFISGRESAQIIHLRFQHPPEALHRTVVNASAHSGHTLSHLCGPEFIIENAVCVLESSATVKQRMGIRVEGNRFIIVCITSANFPYLSSNPVLLVVSVRDCTSLTFLP